MVEVRVREDDGVNLLRGDGQFLPVAFAPLLLSLEQAAIDQNLQALPAIAIEGGIEQVL